MVMRLLGLNVSIWLIRFIASGGVSVLNQSAAFFVFIYEIESIIVLAISEFNELTSYFLGLPVNERIF